MSTLSVARGEEQGFKEWRPAKAKSSLVLAKEEAVKKADAAAKKKAAAAKKAKKSE